MNRSFSKIRHIQEANALLEKRVISEQDTVDAGVPVASSEQTPPVQPKDPNAIEPTEVKNNKIPLCTTKLPAGVDVNADNLTNPQGMKTMPMFPMELPQGTVTILYDGSMGPENKGFRVSVNGKPFCFIPSK
jgi:hypothetical protein